MDWQSLFARRHWIFDLDGTLTEPVHDFAWIREELGLSGGGTLEALAALPAEQQPPLRARLDAIGWEYALQARLQPGAREFLEQLREAGCRLGLVTRNNRANLDESLRRIACEDLFAPELRLSRDDPPPKPAPDPLLRLLARWGAAAEDAVMVGDAIYDLQAGRAAGTATLHLDPEGNPPDPEWADYRFTGWEPLLARWASVQAAGRSGA